MSAMSDDAELTRAELQMELDVCRERANNLLEHHKYIVCLLCVAFIVSQAGQLGLILYRILAR